jgi:mRNA-degrading endonuclease RelE of RelBE toxin-antitoxin system
VCKFAATDNRFGSTTALSRARDFHLQMITKLENPCVIKKDFCINCHSHFMTVRPLIKAVVVSKHFMRDFKDEDAAGSVIKDILDCSNADFHELHKFEENIGGNLVFRAKKGGMHIVYGVDKEMRIIFLRAFRNYSEYEKFLDGKKEIRKIMAKS